MISDPVNISIQIGNGALVVVGQIERSRLTDAELAQFLRDVADLLDPGVEHSYGSM